MGATALYARISRDERGTERGVERQLEDARQLAQARGWADLVEFRDNDVSAYSGTHRPGYAALMQAVEAGEVERILVYMTSRLWRSRTERAAGIEVLKERAVPVFATRGPELDLSTAAGRMLADVLGSFDTHESEVKGERVARAAQQRAEEGRANGPVAYGWERVREGDDWNDVENPAEAKVVREIVDRLLAGDTMRGIADDLNERGVPTPSRRPGVVWRHTTLRKLATRPANIAKRVHRGEVIGDAAWPAIVDEDKHARVCALLKSPARRQHNDAARRHLLTYGVGECGVCGGPLRVQTKRAKRKDGTKAYTLYVCEEKGCVGRSVAKVDELAEAAAVVLLERPDAAYLFAGDAEGAEAAYERAEGIRARLNEAADQYADGAIDGEQMKRITSKLRPELEAAEREAEHLSPAVVDLPPGLLGEKAEATWRDMDVNGRRRVMDLIGMRVQIMQTRQGPGFDPDSVVIEVVHPAER